MKKLFGGASALVVALVAVLFAGSAQAAATTTTTFPVNITLTSACAVTTAPTVVSFTYTSMQTTAATATGTSVGITCTNSLPYSVSLATSPGNGYTVTDAATGLQYSLTLNGTAADLTGQTGNGAAQTVAVGGTMAANQAGTCATASCTNSGSSNLTQTLTISY